MKVVAFTLTDGERLYNFDADFMSEEVADRIIDLMNAWKNKEMQG